MKSKIFILISTLVITLSLFSQESQVETQPKEEKGVDYKQVDGLENWTYDYNVSDLDDGEYNLLIRSRDKAGNIALDGPINVFIDSQSDLPVVSISSPTQEMRVGGNFNVVGTAEDDDDVASVSVKVDDGQWFKAEGTQFWSTFIDTTTWEDGKHIIYAKSTDINGLEGLESSVFIRLDKTKPVINITSHSNGEILSGRNKISGSVFDANTVRKLEFSLDGEIWEELKLSGKDENIERDFSLNIDTKDNPGGTSYIRFRAIDGTGSEGSTVFVYYSDNEKPKIEIIYPQKEDILNGMVSVTGTIKDDVGIQSFVAIKDGGEEEEIPLLPGNPFWSRTFDFTGSKSGTLIFKAVDLSGNTEEQRLKLSLNPDADLPVISFIDFEDKSYLDSVEPAIKGLVRDDDGISSITYSVDDSEAETENSNGSFILSFDTLEPGEHNLKVFGTDIYGTVGKTVKTSFIIASDKPVLYCTQYIRDKEILPWVDGAVFEQGKIAKINGIVEGGESKMELFLTFQDQEESIVKVLNGAFSLTLPRKLEPGSYDISLRIVDSLGREDHWKSRVYIAPAPEKDQNFIAEQQDPKDLYIFDSRIGGSNPALITKKVPLTGYIVGDKIRTIELIPPQTSFTASWEANNFAIEPTGESGPVQFSLKVTGDSGKEYTTSELYLSSDISGPDISLEALQVPVLKKNEALTETLTTNKNGEDLIVEETRTSTERAEVESSVINDSVILKGKIKDISGINNVEISLSGSAESYISPQTLTLTEDGGSFLINKELDLSSLVEGEHFLTLKITDESGNESKKIFPFILDRSKPEIQILSPGMEEPVDGIITVSGRINNFINGGELLFAKDGENFVSIDMMTHNTFSYNIDLSEEGTDPEKFVFKAVDRGRNEVLLTPRFNVDLEADKPVAAVELPTEGETIRNDFDVTGLVFDDDAVESIFYSIDGGEYSEIEGNFYYNIPLKLDDLDDGVHLISIYAVDTGGFPSDVVNRNFIISKAEPVSTLTTPSIETYIKSTVLISGETFDENGIDQVLVSYDNGVTFNEAKLIDEKPIKESSELDSNNTVDKTSDQDLQKKTVDTTVKWEYTFDSRLPGDGTNSILVKAIDGSGTEGISSTIINIDNTIPEIKLDSPGESSLFSGQLIIDGKVFDKTGVKSVETEIKALENKEMEAVFNKINTEGVFKEIVDISSYEPGWYNLNVTVTDYANNSISETRNFKIIPVEKTRSIDIFFPEEGKSFSGPFAIDGQIKGAETSRLLLKIDGQNFDTTEADENGLFSFAIEENGLTEGRHIIEIESGNENTLIKSMKRVIFYQSKGPWVGVNNMISGQFVSGRPMVTGSAGYSGLGEEERNKTKEVEYIDVSLDNGKSFARAKGKEEWEFRLETYDLPEGINQLLIRAHFKDGSIAVSKLFVNIDETAPEISLFSPEENQTFNESIHLVGTASDSNGLEAVEVLIREGKKEKYEVPSFIQGLYLDFHALGSTYGELGIGLSFFDDVVKLQVQAGLAPPGRFSGIVIGAKLLATILDVPFSYFFGYDWDFFSMSLAIGANFNYFSMSEDDYSFTENGVVLGSVLLQLEFAKFEINSLSVFNSYSLYTEGALWFISSDIEAGVTPTISFGLRIGIF